MKNKFISIVSLCLYTQIPDFENQLHLVFLIEDYPKQLLNQINCLVKAENIHMQYMFEDKIKLIDKEYGKNKLNQLSLSQYEKSIENKIESIMTLDIELLRFISTVPDRIENNSFKLPKNADVSYLMNEYIMIKEKQIISKINKAYNLSKLAQFNSNFVELHKLSNVTFNNERYLSRVKKVKKDQEIDNIDDEHDYILLLDFISIFFENKSYRTIDEKQLLKADLLVNLDARQISYAMASMFSTDQKIHQKISLFFSNDILNEEINNDTSKRKKTSMLISKMTLRECKSYANRIMVIIVYFMLLEKHNKVSNNNFIKIPKYLENYRNQLIIILNRMIKHLIEYIQFKATSDKYKIVYSVLPLIQIKNIDPKKEPITEFIHILQYTLNFASFLCNSL